MAEQPEKCPKCGMAFYRTVQDAGSYLGGDDTLVSYSVDVDEFECSSRGTRDEGFFNQSGICLIRERDALRARVAELEALDKKWGETYRVQSDALAAKERRIAELEAERDDARHTATEAIKLLKEFERDGDHIIMGTYPEFNDGCPDWWIKHFDALHGRVECFTACDHSRHRVQRVAELEAALAGSVPREVALKSCRFAADATERQVRDAALSVGHAVSRAYPTCYASTAIAALARAEAEHTRHKPFRRESFAELCADILAWQAATFPHRTPSSITEHLRREATELAKEPGDAEEMADVGLLLIAAADASGVDLMSAMRAKLEKNKRRTWGAPDAQGVVSHVEPAEAEARAAGEEPPR